MSKIAVLSAALVVLGLAPYAAAQAPAAAPSGKPPWVVACEADMKKHCEAEMKANGDVRPCLAKNEDALSEACQKTFVRQYKILQLCKDDIAKHCGEGTDGASVKKCFMEKADKMSEQCRGALAKGAKAHEKQQAAAAKTEGTEKPVAKKKAGKKEAATP